MSMLEHGIASEPSGPLLDAESELREKNQITMPRPVADLLGAHAGDRFIWVIEDIERGVVRLHRLQSSYAGSLAGVYGRPDEVGAYLTAERESWDE
jgi:bifunctional DNA-binding transcriptional regulator/antitoxin component of YhaV-PrlF toxin-antitoxin module